VLRLRTEKNTALTRYEEIDKDDLEDAKREAFDEWLEGYVNSLDEDEKVALDEIGGISGNVMTIL